MSDEARDAEAKERKRCGFVDLLGIMSEPYVGTEVSVDHRHAAVEFRLLHSHICQP